LKKTGIDINLFVYDTEKDTIKTKEIVKKLEFIDPDLIIGPVFPENINIVSKYAQENEKIIISPLYSGNDQLIGNTNIFQVVPSKETEYMAISKYTSKFLTENIILVHDADTENQKSIEYLKKSIFLNAESDSIIDQMVFKEVKFNDTLISNIQHSLSQDKKNFIIVASTKEAYVSDVLSNLNRIVHLDHTQNYDISAFGHPSWLSFKNIDIEYFHNLDLCIYTPFYVDFHDTHTKKFLSRCKILLGYEPLELMPKGYNLTYLGYDVAMIFINAIKNYGKDFKKCIEFINNNYLMADYCFQQNGENNGFENTAIVYIKFNKDYTVNKIKLQEKKENSQPIFKK